MTTVLPMAPRTVPRRPRQWGMRLQLVRHLVQLGFMLFIGYLVVSHALLAEGETASAESYCPFGGLETLYRWFDSGGKFIEHAHASNLVLLVAVVLTAIVGRGFFCGWVCPLGAIQQGIAAVSRALQHRVPALGAFGRLGRARFGWLAAWDRPLRFGRYVVLAWVLLGTAYYGRMVFRDVDPWSALLEIASLQMTLGLGVLVMVLLLSFVVERPFCRYACPLGATIGLIGKLSPIAIERRGDACIGCNLCTRACPVGIPVERVTRVTDTNCVMCLECVGACPSAPGLNVTLSLPGTRPSVPPDTRAA
jgi:ferredoxin